MKAKLFVVGMLAILFICGLMGLYVASLAPQPAADPGVWLQDTQRAAQMASTNRLMGFLVTLAFGDGLAMCCALPVILVGLAILFVRAAGPGR